MFIFDTETNDIYRVSSEASPAVIERLLERPGNVAVSIEGDLERLSGPQLVELYNKLSEKPTKRFAARADGIRRVWGLARDMAEETTPVLAPAPAPVDPEPAPQTPAPAPAPTSPKRRSMGKGTNYEPKKRVYPCRAGSVQALLVDLLARGGGVTFDQLRSELHSYAQATGRTPWKDITIRSGLGWDVHSLKGYGIETKTVNGEEAWSLCNYDAAQALGWDATLCGHPDEAEESDVLQARSHLNYNPEERVNIMFLTYPEGMDHPLPHTPRKSAK